MTLGTEPKLLLVTSLGNWFSLLGRQFRLDTSQLGCQLFAHDCKFRRCINADSHAAVANLDHGDGNLVAD